jgi:Flp pilus assembly protein TadG
MKEETFEVDRKAALRGMRTPASARGGRAPARLRAASERGGALVEFAMVVPMFLILMVGMYSFGLLFTQYISLTEAVNIGGEQFSIARGNFTDPCATIAAAIDGASPFLNTSNMGYTFSVNGATSGSGYATFGKGVTPTCASMATTLNSSQNLPVTVTGTLYCTGVTAIKFGNLANFNPLPAASCILTSQITEILQ